MKAEFISPDDPRWKQALSEMQHDLYHLPEYLTLAASHEGGAPVAFLAEENNALFLIPLLIRKLPREFTMSDDLCDAITPYGFPSPIMTPTENHRQLARFIEAFCDAGKALGMVSVFLRLHPLLTLPLETFEKFGSPIKHGPIVYVDLSTSDENLWAEISRDHRTGIQKLLKSGFTSRIDDWSQFDEFVSIYKMTMQRVSAGDFYLFGSDYFSQLRTALADFVHLCTVHAPNGDVAAAGLVTSVEGIVQAHLAGSSNKYLNRAPSKLKYDAVRRWAKENSNSFVLYGGGVSGMEDGLFRFKAGFSKNRADFYTCGIILDDKQYSTACALWEENTRAEIGDSSAFFPAYRCPKAKSNTEETVREIN